MAEREIDGRVFTCNKVMGEQGVNLFLRISTELAAGQGLFEAIAADSKSEILVRAFFDFCRKMNPTTLQPLIMELASLPVVDGKPANLNEMIFEDIIRLMFFAIGVNYSTFLPAGFEVAINGPAPDQTLSV